MKNLLCFFASMLLITGAFSQATDTVADIPKATPQPVRTKIYRVNYYVSGSIIAVGMVSDYFAIGRLKSKPKLTSDELDFINTDQQKNLINWMDRKALTQNIDNRDLYTKISDYGEIAIFLLPALLVIDKHMRRDWLDLLFMYVEGHAVTFTFYNYSPLGPTFTNRIRPFAYYNEISRDDRMNNNNTRNSFFSGHVGSCAYSTFFMAKVYCDYHPEIGAKKYLVYLAASVPPLVIAYARVRSLAHFPSDVAVGFGLGAVIGIVVPALHRMPCSKYLSVGLSTAPEAVGVSVCLKLDHK